MFKTTSKRETMLILFVIPAFVLYTVFVIAPAISSIYLSVTSWDGITDASMKFVGLKNFFEIFNDPRFHGAFLHTIFIAATFTVFVNLSALGLALVVDNVRAGKNIFRSVFYIPVLLSGVIAGFIWSVMYNYSFGIINTLFQNLHLDFLITDWLGKSPNAIISIVITLVWQSTGFYMIIYLASLQGVPVELLEAAKIDGANRWHQFKNITLPLIAGAFTINLTLALIGGLRIFDQVVVMTDGGPGFKTETISYLIYRVAFSDLRQGYGTALAMVLFAMVLILAIFQIKFLRKREVQL